MAGDSEYGFARSLASRNPRGFGALMGLVGAGLLALDWLMIAVASRLSVMLLLVGCGAVLAGVWVIVTGRTHLDGDAPPRWWYVGVFSCAAVGAALGLYLLRLLKPG